MSLQELKKYQGINPRPHDFDEYWDKALEEMRFIDPEVELVPAKFQAPCAECFHLYFTGVGGARVHAKYLRPKNSNKPHPAVLMFHGYSETADPGQISLTISQWFSVAALDCRGQGGLSGCWRG